MTDSWAWHDLPREPGSRRRLPAGSAILPLEHTILVNPLSCDLRVSGLCTTAADPWFGEIRPPDLATPHCQGTSFIPRDEAVAAGMPGPWRRASPSSDSASLQRRPSVAMR